MYTDCIKIQINNIFVQQTCNIKKKFKPKLINPYQINNKLKFSFPK